MKIKKNIKYFSAIAIIIFLILLFMNLTIAQTQDQNNMPNNDPYKASIRISMRLRDGGRAFCSGTIIKIDNTEKMGTILTAGHCLKDGSNAQYFVDYGPGTNQVRANYVAYQFTGDAGQQDIGILTVPVDINVPPGVS